MPPWDEDSSGSQGNYSAADAAADLATYTALKRRVCLTSALVVGIGSLAVLPISRAAAVSLMIGVACGIAGALLLAHGNERLLDRGGVRGFVFSSFFRIAVFAIVPVGLAARGPVWSMACYFAGYFSPVILFAAAAPRAFERK